MDKEAEESFKERRLLHPVVARQKGHLFEVPRDYKKKRKIQDWLILYTVGEFYLGANVLYFLEAQDAMMYKLYDADNKFK